MNTKINIKQNILTGGALSLLGVFLLLTPQSSLAATAVCGFDRDLQMGVIGEDVKCLQKYLNANGFVITATGGGAPGKETGEFKLLTEAALVKWQQANKLSPASGYFGPRSQLVYKQLVSGKVPTAVSASTTISGVDTSTIAIMQKVAELKAQLSGTITKPVQATATGTGSLTSTQKRMREVIKSLQSAEREVSDNDDADDYDDAVDSLADARRDFLSGLLSFLDADYTDAIKLFSDVEDNIDEALDVVGASTNAKEAEDLIDEVNDSIDDAEDKINSADKAGKATSKSEDLIDSASDLLDDAEEALSDKDYDEAIDLAEEAQDQADNALDAIGKKSAGIEEYLDEVDADLDDAWDDVDAAIKNKKDVGDAEDILDEAGDLLDDAEDAIDDGDDSEAEDLIDDAADMIADALDEF
jgi:peptidoglycan hydrolase-like protein with peptidoglycan-binding domain